MKALKVTVKKNKKVEQGKKGKKRRKATPASFEEVAVSPKAADPEPEPDSSGIVDLRGAKKSKAPKAASKKSAVKKKTTTKEASDKTVAKKKSGRGPGRPKTDFGDYGRFFVIVDCGKDKFRRIPAPDSLDTAAKVKSWVNKNPERLKGRTGIIVNNKGVVTA